MDHRREVCSRVQYVCLLSAVGFWGLWRSCSHVEPVAVQEGVLMSVIVTASVTVCLCICGSAG